MVRTQIQLYPEQVRWLKQFGLEKDRSMSQVIRDSIDCYRLQVEKSRIMDSKKKIALKAVGSFSSDCP